MQAKEHFCIIMPDVAQAASGDWRTGSSRLMSLLPPLNFSLPPFLFLFLFFSFTCSLLSNLQSFVMMLVELVLTF